MLKRSSKKDKQQAPAKPPAAPRQEPVQQQQAAPPRPSTPAQEYAKLGADSPIAWPSVGGRRVPVTGKLSPHAQAALRRMGITQENK